MKFLGKHSCRLHILCPDRGIELKQIGVRCNTLHLLGKRNDRVNFMCFGKVGHRFYLPGISRANDQIDMSVCSEDSDRA